MASPNDLPPESTSGKVIVNAQLFAAPGKADILQEHIAAFRKLADSADEPGILEYRTVRSFVEDGSVKFALFEVFSNVAALRTHLESDAFKRINAEVKRQGLLVGTPQIEFFYEFE